MLNHKIYILLVLVWIILPATAGWSRSSAFTPWRFSDRAADQVHASSPGDKRAPSLPARLALSGLRVFSESISRVDGDRCPMYPTCASYSRQAFKKHGFFIGFAMTADRLIHESSEVDYAPRVRVYERMRYYDPVSWNDSWWHHPEGLDK